MKNPRQGNKETGYVYVGDGLGIPGLPHYVTREEAKKLGRLEDLEIAIKRGDYEPAKENDESDEPR